MGHCSQITQSQMHEDVAAIIQEPTTGRWGCRGSFLFIVGAAPATVAEL